MAKTVFDVNPELLIREIARDLKEDKKLAEPGFAAFVKTGAHRERAPENRDWWYVRCASILRRIYADGPRGTESLRTQYGGKRSRGSRPHRFKKASGKVIRLALQELEKKGYLKHEKNKKGRFLTPLGEKYLNEKARVVHSNQEKIVEEMKERKKQKELERKKRAPKEEKKEQKPQGKKKKKESEDPTAVRLKRKQH